jgi:hypothetical protein
MSNWYLEEQCTSCGSQLATNGKVVWCTNKGCVGNTIEAVDSDGINSHKSVHKKG